MDINQDLDGIAVSTTRDSLAEETASNFIGDVMTTEEEVHFVTGSSYKGSWDALGMTGVGRYVMPNGTVYEGEMRDGMFHGHGSLYWSKNQRLDVVHLRGKLLEHKYTFEDGLSYQDEDWSFCRFPDRRFYESTIKGLRPGGRSLKSAKQPTKILPAGCYDAGDGVFDPKTLCVTSYDDSSKILRIPTQEECDWIVDNCRKSWTEPTGYRPSLNENWSDDPPELPYSLAMSKDSPDSWWKRLAKFERDVPYIEEETDMSVDDGYLETPELCFCGQNAILGEPCQCLPVRVTSEIDWQDHLDKRRFYGEPSGQSHEYEEVEGEETPFEPFPEPFADSSLEYVFGERIIEGIEAFAFNIPGFDVSEDDLQNFSSEKFVETYRASDENVEDEVDDEQSLLAAAKSRSEIGNGETKNKENLQTDYGQKLGEIARPIDTVEEEILLQSSKSDYDADTEKPEDFAENIIPEESIVDNQESIKRSDSMKVKEPHKSLNEANVVMIEGREIAGEETESMQSSKAIKELENHDERSKNSVEDKVLQKSNEEIEKNGNSQAENIAANKVLSEDVLPKSTEEIHENVNLQPENIAKSTDEIDNNANSQPEDIASNKVSSKDSRPKSTEEIHENGNSQPEIISKNENKREAQNQDHEEEENSEVAIKKSSVPDSSDKSHKHDAEGPGNIGENAAEYSTNEKTDVPTISRETTLENHDYVTAATIPREKVSGATEPETTNDRRTKTKLLPKASETGSIEEAGQDLQTHRADTEAIKSDDIIATGSSVKLQKNAKSGETETATAAIFSEELVAEELGDHAEYDKLPNDEFDGKKTHKDKAKDESIEKHVESFGEDKSAKNASESQFAEENKEILKGELKTSVKSMSKKSSKASKISEQPLQDLTTKETNVLRTEMADTSRSKLGEEISQKNELTSDSQISSRQVVMREAVSIDDVKTGDESLDSLKTQQISLEKVHPSLASLPPKEQKTSKSEEIIIIHKQVLKKEKPKKKCSNANVWRLSSTLREYSAQTKMPCHSCGMRRISNTEDLHSGAALTAPRSRPVEYGRKPCDARIRKPTTQEVPVIALTCREEYPFNIQAKPDRFTYKRSCSNIREKKLFDNSDNRRNK